MAGRAAEVYKFRPAKMRMGPSMDDKSFLGHPGGLPWMLQVEMWERFSWFGMRAMLLFFLTDTAANQGLGLSDTAGQVVVSAYGAGVLLMTIPGGIIADRLLSPWASGLIGGSVIMLGHVLLAFPSPPMSWAGLICIAMGTGLIKPNLSTIVGGLYDDEDPRRDSGFQYFYMSINVGSLVAPLLVGYLRNNFGYHVGFLAAAIGMACAIAAFVIGRHKLGAFAFRVPNPMQPGEGIKYVGGGVAIIVFGAALVLGFNALLGELTSAIAYALFVFALITASFYFITMFKSPKVTHEERVHLTAFLPLWIGQVLFVLIFEQAAGKMATFAADHTDRIGLSPEVYQSVNPAAVLILSPIMAWLFLRRKGKFPNTAAKFAISLVIIALSAAMMGFGFTTWPGGAVLAPFWYLGLVFVVQTVAELFMNPVGLSVTTKLAPKQFASQTMTLWYLAPAVGMGLTSVIIERTADIGDGPYYYGLAVVTIVVAVGMFFLAPWIQSKMNDVDERELAGAEELGIEVAGNEDQHQEPAGTAPRS